MELGAERSADLVRDLASAVPKGGRFEEQAGNITALGYVLAQTSTGAFSYSLFLVFESVSQMLHMHA